MSDIPECPWRFGERYLVTDFVQVNNVAVKGQAAKLAAGTKDDYIRAVAAWIRDDFFYPLDSGGNPSAQGQFLRHQKGIMQGYFAKKCVYYAWSFPNEILGFTRCGICIDTAQLAGSVLIAGGIDAWVILGDVRRSTDDSLLGRHAWVEVPYQADQYIIEATIHKTNIDNMVKASSVYDKKSDWAKTNNLYYPVQAKYNESIFDEVGPLGSSMIELMGMPAKKQYSLGLEKTKCESSKKLFKEWRQQELLKEKIIAEAYRSI